MKTSLIKVYILGLLLVATFGRSHFFGGRYESERLLQTATDTTIITLPPNFVVLNENLTLYYQFNANSTAANASSTVATTTPTTLPADTTTTPADATTTPTTTPTDATTTPADATTVPTDATTTPTDTTTTPTTSNSTDTIDLFIVLLGHSPFEIGFPVNGSNATIDWVAFDIVNDAIVVSNQDTTDTTSATATPEAEGEENDWKLVNFTMNETTMIIQVTRLQNTGDPMEFVFTGPGDYTILWAYMPPANIVAGMPFGSTNVTLLDTNAPVTDTTQPPATGTDTTQPPTTGTDTTEPPATNTGGV